MANLVVPMGIPGSGKSTWGWTMFGGKYKIVCSDDIRRRRWGSLQEAHNCDEEEKAERNKVVWEEFYRNVHDSLQHNVDTYADGTNLRDFARKRLLDIARETGAQTHIIIFGNTVQGRERNSMREEDQHVPHEIMSNFDRSFKKAMEEVPMESWRTRTLISSLD